MTKCDEKDIEIRNIHAEVERNNEKIHVLQTDIGNQINSHTFLVHLSQRLTR